MMYPEFEERTGYQPSSEEYSLIEESYYNFDGNKDEFCKEWLKWKKSGAWEREAKIIKTYLATTEVQDAELQVLRQYRDDANKVINGLNEKIEQINTDWLNDQNMRIRDYNQVKQQGDEARDQVRKLQAELEAKDNEIIKLKAKLYDLMTK